MKVQENNVVFMLFGVVLLFVTLFLSSSILFMGNRFEIDVKSDTSYAPPPTVRGTPRRSNDRVNVSMY
ncbi:MAG: hypothetical protein OEZ59_11325, partial [Deltaproteobacteria bacterium]|nr:hypothetical protein [Deltaproteobacteria bacterium]